MSWNTEIEKLIIADDASLAAQLGGVDLAATYPKKRAPMAKGHGYLSVAVWSLAPGAVRALLDVGADPNQRDAAGLTPLLALAKGQRKKGKVKGLADVQTEIAKVLLEKGADPNVGDEEGLTALHEAASRGQLELMEALLAHGAAVNALSKDDPEECFDPRSALWSAAEALQPKAIELLVANGADPNIGAGPPLVIVTRTGDDLGARRSKCVRALVKESSEETRRAGLFAEFRSVIKGDPTVVQLLLDSGVDPNATHFGRTPLSALATRAVTVSDGQVVWPAEPLAEVLMEAADVNAKDDDGWTPLHGAAYFLNLPLVERLLAKGADVSATLTADHPIVGVPGSFPAGSTPLAVAQERSADQPWEGVKEKVLALLA